MKKRTVITTETREVWIINEATHERLTEIHPITPASEDESANDQLQDKPLNEAPTAGT